LPKNTNLLIIAPATEEMFNQLLNHGLEWGSRYASLWMLPGIFQRERDGRQATADERAQTLDIAKLTRDSLREDIERWQPNPVLVERYDDETIEPCLTLESFRVNLLLDGSSRIPSSRRPGRATLRTAGSAPTTSGAYGMMAAYACAL
jgi:hypothetical protein